MVHSACGRCVVEVRQDRVGGSEEPLSIERSLLGLFFWEPRNQEPGTRNAARLSRRRGDELRSCVVVIGGGEEKGGEGMERKGRDGKRSNEKNAREIRKGRMVHQVRQYSGILPPLLLDSRL